MVLLRAQLKRFRASSRRSLDFNEVCNGMTAHVSPLGDPRWESAFACGSKESRKVTNLISVFKVRGLFDNSRC